MAKKNQQRRKQGIVSKIKNALLLVLGLARPIQIVSALGFTTQAANQIIHDSTFGLSSGSFDLQAGLRMYTPPAAALATGKLINYLLKRFPIR